MYSSCNKFHCIGNDVWIKQIDKINLSIKSITLILLALLALMHCSSISVLYYFKWVFFFDLYWNLFIGPTVGRVIMWSHRTDGLLITQVHSIYRNALQRDITLKVCSLRFQLYTGELEDIWLKFYVYHQNWNVMCFFKCVNLEM